VTYMNRNGKAVEDYLEENPDIKQRIDDLSAELNALMEQEEALMGEGEDPPPLP
jgi:cell division septum initiation protein DivIVA